MPKGNVRVSIDADVRGLKRGVDQANRELGRMNKSVGTLKKVAGGLAGAFAVSEVVDFAKQSVMAYEDVIKVNKQTDAVLRSTRHAAGLQRKEIQALAQEIQKKTAIDDQQIQTAENLLLTFTNIGKKVFPDATKAVVDMSVALGQDFKSSSIQVGKALNDPVKGLTALRRVGVSFTEDQKKQVEALVKSGKTMEAQKLILRELNKEFGGSAEKAVTPFKRMQDAVGELQETVGKWLYPAVTKAATAMAKFITQFNNGTGAGGRFRDKLKEIWDNLKPTAEWLGRAAANVKKFADKHPIVYKLAGTLLAVGAAVKTIKFLNAITGLSSFVSAAKNVGKTLLPIFQNIGKRVAGAFAANAAETAAEQLPLSFEARKGRMSGPLNKMGKGFGGGFGKAFAAGFALTAAVAAYAFAREFIPKLSKALQDKAPGWLKGVLNFGQTLSENIPGLPTYKSPAQKQAEAKQGKAFGGPIFGGVPGRDSVPALLMPGEHVLTTREVQNAGGHSAIFALRRRLGGGTQAKGLGMAAGGLVGGAQSLYEFLVQRGFRPTSTTGGKHAPGSYHYSGKALDYGNSINNISRLADILWPMRRQFAELFIPTTAPHGGLYHSGSRFTNSALQAQHQDHIHVAVAGGLSIETGGGSTATSKSLGTFTSTAYGPPWNAMEGSGVTATGTKLSGRKYIVAVDPRVIPLGSKLKIWPNPYGYRGTFEADDTGGAIKGKRIDFYVAEGRSKQNGWGRRPVRVSLVTKGSKRIKGRKIEKPKVTAKRSDKTWSQQMEDIRQADYTIAQGTPGFADDIQVAQNAMQYWQGVYDRAVADYKKNPNVTNSARVANASQNLATWRGNWEGSISAQNEAMFSGQPSSGGSSSSPDENARTVQQSIEALNASIAEMNARAKAGMGLERRVIAQAIADMTMGQVGGPLLRGIQSPSFAGVRY